MLFSYDKDLQQCLTEGTKKAIGWGISSDLLYKVKQAPYKFEFLIDGTKKDSTIIGNATGLEVYGSEKIAGICSSEYVIVILADLTQYGEEITRQIAQYGQYTVTVPYSPWFEKNIEQKIKHFVCKHRKYLDSNFDLSQQKTSRNIALVIYGFTRGGAEWQFYLLVKALIVQGHSVSVFYFTEPVDTTKCWLDELSSVGVSLFCLRDYIHKIQISDNENLVDELLGFLSTYESRLVLAMLSLMGGREFNCCISYLLSANVLASLSAVLVGIPNTLISTRCSAPGTVGGDFIDSKIVNIDLGTSAQLLEILIKYAGVNIAANSNVGAESYAKWLNIEKSSISIVPNGLLEPAIVSKKSIRDAYCISDSAFLVIGVMRLTDQKRPLLFLNCIDVLSQRHPNLKVLLIGDGALFAEVQKTINEKGLEHIITLLGEQTNATDFMQAADVLLHTPKFEGLPNVILEAQQVGCPVVCSNAGGSLEALAPEVVSLCLVDSDEPGEFVSKVLGFIERENIEHFKIHANCHIQHMTLEKLAVNTLYAACQG
jgi:glycosyltransferase involved in cell wall biosynthesis/5S rRNA maturation endonuclease (ribonuclease M5)